MPHLYQKPVTDVHQVKTITGLSAPTAYKLIEELEKLNILEEITGAKRGRLYMFTKYVHLFV